MTKQELDNITGLTSTMGEFAAISNLYMRSDMNKETAAKIYKLAYGEKAEARASAANAPVTAYEIASHWRDYGRQDFFIRGRKVVFVCGEYHYFAHVVKDVDIKTGKPIYEAKFFYNGDGWEHI